MSKPLDLSKFVATMRTCIGVTNAKMIKQIQAETGFSRTLIDKHLSILRDRKQLKALAQHKRRYYYIDFSE
jgi:hypothetical protein